MSTGDNRDQSRREAFISRYDEEKKSAQYLWDFADHEWKRGNFGSINEEYSANWLFSKACDAAAAGNGAPAAQLIYRDWKLRQAALVLGQETLSPEEIAHPAPDTAADVDAVPAAAPAIPRDPDKPFYILHLSDLHFTQETDPVVLQKELAMDLGSGHALPRIGDAAIDFLVVTGDIANTGSVAEYKKASQFLLGLMDNLFLSAEQCILVPGNHDVDWTQKGYDWIHVDDVGAEAAKKIPQTLKHGKLVLTRNEESYKRRFHNYSTYLYGRIFGTGYPENPAEQVEIKPDASSGIPLRIMALNSCHEIDRFNEDNAGIHNQALTNCLYDYSREWRDHDARLLKIAVWHHPVKSGTLGAIGDTDFLQKLRQAGFKLILHGHIHNHDVGTLGHRALGNEIQVLAAGTFGATDRPPSTPFLYHLIEISPDLSEATVYSRMKGSGPSGWQPGCMWPDKSSDYGSKVSYFTMDF